MRNKSAQKDCTRTPALACATALIVFGLLASSRSAAAQTTTGPTTGITINSGAGPTTISNNLALGGSSQTIAVNNAAGLLISGSVAGTIGLTKTGTITVTLSGTNTYTGTTTIKPSTLNAGAAGALGGTSNIVVNAGGTLLLSQSGTTDRINNSSTMTLNGGTFNTSGLSEHSLSGVTVIPGIGALTLSNSSIIDLGAGASVLAFANSSAQTWSGMLRHLQLERNSRNG